MRGTNILQRSPWFRKALRSLAALAACYALASVPPATVRGEAPAGGYLARNGPPPLRFVAPSSRTTPKTSPSPGPAGQGSGAHAATPLALSDLASATTNTLDPLLEPLPAPDQTVATPVELTSLPTNRLVVITPQMLAEYLKPDGAGRDTNTLGPAVWFVPPAPKPDSKASYRSPEPTHAN